MDNTILIVDDSTDGTLLTEMALTSLRLPITLKKVTSGWKALEYLRTAQDLPVLVLLDLKMPGLNGIETLKQIRSDERLKHLPVVITTLSTLDTDREAARSAGATGFVYKAIRMDDFSKGIEQYVKCCIREAATDS